jgi:hypothetical protein
MSRKMHPLTRKVATDQVMSDVIAAIDRVTHDPDVRFVANLIITRHSSPIRKLRGLEWLVRQGYDVRTASHDCDTLIVAGEIMSWTLLNSLVRLQSAVSQLERAS